MRAGMIALVIAMGVVAWLPRLPPWWLPAGALVGAIALASASLWRNRSWPRWSSMGCGASLGVLYAVLSGQQVTQSLLPVALEQQPLWLSGRIVGLIESRPAYGRQAQRFSLRVDACRQSDNSPCAVVLHTVQLTFYESASSNPSIPIPIASGERWQLPVKLKRPHGLANPGGFDFESWLVQQRFSATGTVTTQRGSQRLAPASVFSVDRWRAAVRDDLQQRLQPFTQSPLLLALLVGDGSAITRADWSLFRSTGTIHLFVVSGSHIAFTGGLIWWLGRLWRRSPFSTSSRREHVLCALPALLVALGYALLAGMGLPIQRALIMFAVVLIATTLRRDLRFFDALLLALVLVLLRDPLAARDAGCWFSFAAVSALALAFAGASQRGEQAKDRWGWLRAQWLIFVVCLPVLMLISGQLTLLSLPANLIAVPLTTVITLPLAFTALLLNALSPVLGTSPEQWCWYAADLSLRGLLSVLGWLRDIGGGLVLPLASSPHASLYALSAVLLLLLPRGVPGRALALVLLLPVLWPRHPEVPSQSVRVTVIDVGQGLSVLVETRSHRLLYDTGPAFGTGSSAAELAVLPLLRQRGVRELNMLMVSHRDSDHAGGVGSILQALQVDDMLVGDRLPVTELTPVQRSCAAGQQWRWDEVQFTVLNPLPAAVDSGNNHSCVLLIEVGQSSVLLAGDIEKPIEQRLLDDGRLRPTTVLVAPHHGSRSSSSTAFVQKLQPRYVVFSTGYHNRFGHPHPLVAARYRAVGAQLLNTTATGALTFELRNNGVAAVTEYRKSYRHFWDEPAFPGSGLTGF